MDEAAYLEWTSHCEVPTASQQVAFAQHVASAHSWYKHLSLVTGGEFVVFVAPDAGGSYTADRPRLHYGWKTAAEYHARFGYLDYAWRRGPDQAWSRDAGVATAFVREPSVVYPYVAYDLTVYEWECCHEADLRTLVAGAAHPRRDQLITWHRWATELVALEAELVGDEPTLIYERVFGDDPPPPMPSDHPRVERCVELERTIHGIRLALEAEEDAKLAAQVARFVAWFRASRA